MKTKRAIGCMVALCITALLGNGSTAQAQAPGAAPPPAPAIVPEVEESDVARLPKYGAHWLFVTDAFGMGGTRIVDGDSGKIMATVHGGQLADFAADRNGNGYYVADSIWTRGNRGTRQDLLTVYDPATLTIRSEIAIPGRLLIGVRAFMFSTSTDGRFGYVFNMDPAASIVVVDLVKRKFLRSVELPGCGLVMPAPDGTTTSLCSDGSLATTSYDGTPRITRSEVFFPADKDPIFDNSAVDSTSGKALFLSYSGLIYEARLGAAATIAHPWSIQQAAGLPAGETRPIVVNWLPGGRQPIAWHRDSGRAYVLMHTGEYWSQKAPASELWEMDVASHKLVRRIRLDTPAEFVAVSQGPDPLLYLGNEQGDLRILDAATFTERHKLSRVGFGNLAVPGN